jgi:hypothetical protein
MAGDWPGGVTRYARVFVLRFSRLKESFVEPEGVTATLHSITSSAEAAIPGSRLIQIKPVPG